MILVDTKNSRCAACGNLADIMEDTIQALRTVHTLVCTECDDETADFFVRLAVDAYRENKEVKKSERVERYTYTKGDSQFEQFLKDKYNLPL